MKIKILFTTTNFDTAGSGKVLYDLAKGLNKEKFDISIACKNSKGTFFKEIEKLQLPIHIVPIDQPLIPYRTLFSRLQPFRSFLKKEGFDIVHSWHWSSDWTEALAVRLQGAKYVYTKKAMTWGNIHWKIRSFLSHFIITLNDEMKFYFPNKKNQKLIPLGIDSDYYNPLLFSNNNHDRFTIITVANLVPVKGIEVLIKAIDRLQNPSIHLDILGDTRDTYADVLQQLVVDLNLENQVSFLGKHTDVRPFLAQSDLYIIPTLDEGRKEGMPMALVEAMCMGIPVLGSNITGIKYVLRDFQALLFEANSAASLSDKITGFYAKSCGERKAIGKSLREYCIENFSMQKFIQEHEDLYLKLTKKNK